MYAVLPVERPGAKIATHDLAVVGRAVLGGGQAGRDGDRGRKEDQLVHGCTSAATERLQESTVHCPASLSSLGIGQR